MVHRKLVTSVLLREGRDENRWRPALVLISYGDFTQALAVVAVGLRQSVWYMTSPTLKRSKLGSDRGGSWWRSRHTLPPCRLSASAQAIGALTSLCYVVLCYCRVVWRWHKFEEDSFTPSKSADQGVNMKTNQAKASIARQLRFTACPAFTQ